MQPPFVRLATAIVMLFENRHNTLVRGRFKIEAEWIRYTFYAINGIYALLFLLPVYFQIPDPEWAKPILLKVILPCPHPSYFQNNVFVFSMEISAVTGTAGIFLLFFLAEVFILCIHSSFFLLSLKTHMSPATQKLQIKFFVDMIFQVSIPVAVIVLPMTYCFYSIVWQYYNQMLNNIAIICISLHGMGSTITLIWLNPSYRQFTISVITCFRYDPSFRRSSVMTVIYFFSLDNFELAPSNLITRTRKMTLSVIVRENSKSQYRIVLRNTSIYDVAVKIVNPNESPKLDRLECLVLSNKYTDITVLETPSKAVLCGNKQKPVSIYCRAIYPFNRKNIRHWIEGHVTDKPQHLVQTLNFVVDDAEFSAKTIVVDLPGKSTMVESTGYALKMNNSKKVLRAFLENDTTSACQFESKSVLKCLLKVAKPDTLKSSKTQKPEKAPIEKNNEDACFVVPLFKALCNPKTKVETMAH
ncbi:hypothetical protein L3Y34_018217 [Caenorhabditis briggsae]|uniref:Uncharacterized protein n=3 Tax=Caenorhabditis briggsae TaxID=6238 RepID=A0AAE9IUU7_CAEBR|nr:hypothetical protein L3Y34_018217 [Caenorhabditis briggsae]